MFRERDLAPGSAAVRRVSAPERPDGLASLIAATAERGRAEWEARPAWSRAAWRLRQRWRWLRHSTRDDRWAYRSGRRLGRAICRAREAEPGGKEL